MAHNRAEVVVAAFAAAGPGAAFDPLRIQKLMFLIDREVSDRIGGPFFSFAPYLYGPFDSAIYDVIDELLANQTVAADTSGAYPRYYLMESGSRQGSSILASFPDAVAGYFGRVSRWVWLVPYRQMLAAVYRRYPEMAKNSVVRHLVSEGPSQRQNSFLRGMTRVFDTMGSSGRPPDAAVGLESDVEAIGDVWRAVGNEIEEAMVQFGASERLW